MTVPVLKAIIPKHVALDPERLGRAIENTLNGLAKDIKVDFDVTTQTWDHRPEFKISAGRGRRRVATASDIYRYLNDGTRVRYATMTPGFSPKTRRRYIGSNKGRGGVAIISKLRPRPGIQAREFNKAIREKWQKLAPGIFQRAIDAEVNT